MAWPQPGVSAMEDAAFMAHALALGRRNLGLTWPNPSVGAVVVSRRSGMPVVVGRGVTQPGGRPHGEAMAFAQAGEAAAGATLYVALEPCSHRSLRGHVPCVEATVRAGVRRVVSAMADPNPMIAGLGHALLRAAGIEVAVGTGGQEAARINRGHVLRVTEGRPMVTLKLARTADGYVGGAGGTRLQVSGEFASRWVHLQRARHDAIMVGVSTVIADDPRLDVRLPGLEDRSPVRVVLDSRLSIPPMATLVRTARDIPTWVVATTDAPVEPERALVAAGVEVMRVDSAPDGRIDLSAALRLLGTRGVTRVFSEGGPTVAAELARLGLADEIVLSVSPNRLGEPGVEAIRPGLAMALADASRYRLVETGSLGEDACETWERVV